MQDSTFIGLDVHKATISLAQTAGERGGEVRHLARFRTGPTTQGNLRSFRASMI